MGGSLKCFNPWLTCVLYTHMNYRKAADHRWITSSGAYSICYQLNRLILYWTCSYRVTIVVGAFIAISRPPSHSCHLQYKHCMWRRQRECFHTLGSAVCIECACLIILVTCIAYLNNACRFLTYVNTWRAQYSLQCPKCVLQLVISVQLTLLHLVYNTHHNSVYSTLV